MLWVKKKTIQEKLNLFFDDIRKNLKKRIIIVTKKTIIKIL